MRSALFLLSLAPWLSYGADPCIDRHKQRTPNIVSDWQLSKHSQNGIACSTCHGDKHTSAADVSRVEIPTPETCRACHPDQVEQFLKSKHAVAWAAMKAMPMAHAQPVAMMRGIKGCGGCHKIGIMSENDLAEIQHMAAELRERAARRAAERQTPLTRKSRSSSALLSRDWSNAARASGKILR